MGSAFKGIDYFGSGPHRFYVGKQGRRVISLAAVAGDVTFDGSLEFGDLELRVEVRGRLVSSSETGLWALRDALVAESESTVGSGILEDHFGRQWTGVKLLTVEYDGAIARGREFSIGYRASFGVLETS